MLHKPKCLVVFLTRLFEIFAAFFLLQSGCLHPQGMVLGIKKQSPSFGDEGLNETKIKNG